LGTMAHMGHRDTAACDFRTPAVTQTQNQDIRKYTKRGNLKGRDYVEDIRPDGKIILKWILRKTRPKCVDYITLAKGSNQKESLWTA
jgi:hypothetical protein